MTDNVRKIRLDVTSVFLPTEALQGQDIPSHLLWKGSEYTEIEIRYSDELRLSEIYNVAQANYTDEKNTLLVRHVDFEGYLGLLFKSSKQATSHTNCKVDYTFRKDTEVVFRSTKSVYLFRQDLALLEAPTFIRIEKNGRLDKRIRVGNRGEGTAIVYAHTTSESPLKQVQPAYVREFFANYYKDLTVKLERLKEQFPAYSDIINYLIQHGPKTDSSTKPDALNHDAPEEKLRMILERDRVFTRKLIEAFVSCILGNIYFRTLAEVFLDYINSVGKNRTLLADPFSVLEVPSGESDVELQIESTDLLNAKYDSLPVLKIHLEADEGCEVPLHRLIGWE